MNEAITKPIWPTIAFLGLFTLLFGVVYPALVTLVLQVSFSTKANGSLITSEHGTVGSQLLGQSFSQPHYFWGRLSATDPFPYNSGASSGSNLSLTNPQYLINVKARSEALAKADPTNSKRIPIDLVTASASGLDPHISIEAAFYQATRVAQARNMQEANVNELIAALTEQRKWGFLGEPTVNVLKLNRALDQLPKNS
jgi:K+-transporting ATPase ATPase C chain